MPLPFTLSPNPAWMYLTDALHGALDKIRFAIEARQGLSVIMGDVGLGKSTILRLLHAEYYADSYVSTLLTTADFPSPFAMLKKITADFGIEPKRSLLAQRDAFEAYLVDQYQAGKVVLVFIDEAQRLGLEQLELIRTLLNFETDHVKLIQLILAGQLDLQQRLLSKRNKAFRSRIFAPCHLVPLSRAENAAMIQFRCERTGIPNPFEPDAVDRIYELSSGVPRQILLLCAHSHNFALRLKHRSVSADLIEAANDETAVQKAEAIAV